MRFLRTASTGRLIAAIGAMLVLAVGGAAIAVAATGSGPAPRPTTLARAVHRVLAAPPVSGISADVTFTDNLIDSSDLAGQPSSDPLLQGASGRLWIAADGGLRLELQASNGDTEVVVRDGRFFAADPSTRTTYEGSLPTAHSATGRSRVRDVPTLATIQSAITRLARGVDLSGAVPTDVAGRPAYRVTISPRHGGLVGAAALAVDAARGVPLQLSVFARGSATPVLSLTATHVAYGPVPASTLDIAPPVGNRVVDLGDLSDLGGAGSRSAAGSRHAVRGIRAVARRLPFALAAPQTLAGRPRRSVTLVSAGAHPTALVAYGRGLGGLLVLESRATRTSSGVGSVDGMQLPSVSIDGATATELATPLGTALHLVRGGVADTVLGSVTAGTAQVAARALAAAP